MVLIIILLFVLVYYFFFTTSETRPDTFANKRFFEKFTKTEITPDIKNIYCYSNEIGFDAVYRMKFNCNREAVKTIASNLQLEKSEKPDEGLIGGEPVGWDDAVVRTVLPYRKEDGRRNFWFLWYDSTHQQAYFLKFDS